MTTPAFRFAQVVLGPFKEWASGANGAYWNLETEPGTGLIADPTVGGNAGIFMFGDGSQVGYRIKFTCPKHVMSTAAPTVISVYNLPDSVKRAASVSGVNVALSVGWSNVGQILLHTGSLLAVYSAREGADIVTHFVSNPAWGGFDRVNISKTVGGNYSVKQLFIDLARLIPGITVNDKNIAIDSTKKFGRQGLTLPVARVDSHLNKLARVYGFNWHIDNKIIYAVDDDAYIPGTKVLISSQNDNILRAEPILMTAFQKRAGVNITALLNPYIMPGKTIELRSITNQALNGDYVVHNMTHNGDTHSQQFETSITSWIVL